MNDITPAQRAQFDRDRHAGDDRQRAALVAGAPESRPTEARCAVAAGSALPPSFAILKQALVDDAFEGGEVACFGDYSVSWNTREGIVAIADSGGWWTIPGTDLKAIAAATPNNGGEQHAPKT